MKVKIYQLPVEHERCFRGFDVNKRVSMEDYELVWEGELDAKAIEEVYVILNRNPPEGYKARSLSVSDIVGVAVGWQERLYFCDSVGWVRIEGAMPEMVLLGRESKHD